MDKIEKSRIENNSLKAEIETILQLRDDAAAEDNDNSFFGEPIDEEEMTSWEQKTGVTIPKSYKEWLRFTGECKIDGFTAKFWRPGRFPSNRSPEGYVVIGEMVGDGELVCFSKGRGEFVEYFEGKISIEYDDFKGVLNEVIRMFRINIGKPDKSDEEFHDRIMKLMNEILEKRNKQ